MIATLKGKVRKQVLLCRRLALLKERSPARIVYVREDEMNNVSLDFH